MSEENLDFPSTPPEPTPEEQPALTEPAPEEQPSQPEATRRKLFDRQTRSGRMLHTALIHIIVAGIAFAVGMLVMYLWLYRPIVSQLNTSYGETAAVTTELEQARSEHDQTRAVLQTAEDEVQTLQQTVETQEQQIGHLETRVRLLRVMYHSRAAQSALQNRDQTAARRSVQDARRELDAALPAVEAEDSEVAQSLSMRLDLVSNGMVRDATTARSDLEILINNLILLERLLAQR